MVVAEIGQPPPSADGPFGGMMLKANYLYNGTGGAVICQNPETGAYAVMRSYPLARETFAQAIEALVNTAERWRDVLAGAGLAEDAKAGKDGSLRRRPPPAPAASCRCDSRPAPPGKRPAHAPRGKTIFSNDWKKVSNGWKIPSDFSNDWKNFPPVFQ